MIVSVSSNLNYLGNPQVFFDSNNNIITLSKNAINVQIVLRATILDYSSLDIVGSTIPVGMILNPIVANPSTNVYLFTISGSPTSIHLLTDQDILIKYVDSFLISRVAITASYEVLSPTLNNATQTQCSYCVDLDWINNTIVSNNPKIQNRGLLDIFDTVHLNKLSSFKLPIIDGKICYCESGNYNFNGIYTVREIPNCGGVSPIIFQSIGISYPVTVKEYKPIISLIGNTECCYILGELKPIQFLYSLNDFNNVLLESEKIEYTLTDPDGQIVVFQQNNLSNTPSSTDIFNFQPTMVGKYKLLVELSNGSPCNLKHSKSYELNSCSDWELTNEDCNKFKLINNSSSIINYDFQKYDINTNTFVTIIENAITTLSVYNSIELDYVNDGVNKIVVNGKDFYFISLCNITKCYKNLLKGIVCSSELINNMADDCDSKKLLSKLEKHIKFKYLYDKLVNYYYKFKMYQDFSSQTNVLVITDLTDPITDILEIKDVIKELSKMCGLVDGLKSPCYTIIDSTVTLSNKPDCGCGCS